MDQTIYNTISGEARTVPQAQADHMARNSMGEWSFKQPLPPGWDRVIPRYRVQVDLHPSPLARHRHETPITFSTDSALWQYAEKPVAAGEIVETTLWPHLSMQPINDSATAVRDYLRDHMNSRLPLSPWRNGRLNLDDGLTGTIPDSGVLRPALPQAAPQPVRVAR
jgi:hypothetical protein